MGQKFSSWKAMSQTTPHDYKALVNCIVSNRKFKAIESLDYGDHGLEAAYRTILDAVQQNKKIALYADYDVDGTMSCVSWIWFLRSIGHEKFVYHIPDRFTEGYGVNLAAVKKLVNEDGADLIITMDTGITANIEAKWCLDNGIDFICTDHHKIQPDKMPDCIILNPKMNPDPEYQELCGCGITFVLLRKLAKELNPPASIWVDILALTGMATICDVVPLNGVNHRLARYGVDALLRSKRPVLQKLLAAAAGDSGNSSSKNNFPRQPVAKTSQPRIDETDVGFRLGPRINAVGRLEHAHKVIEAFVNEDPDELIKNMGICNEKRKVIQHGIVEQAMEEAAKYPDDPILFMGGEWHPGVVGIAASKIAEDFWKPVWMFERSSDICKGSARSIPGFDVTDAMTEVEDLFLKFGGHAAAGGFSFPACVEEDLRRELNLHAGKLRKKNPEIWVSKILFDCDLPMDLAKMDLVSCLDNMKPFGHGFEEPRFRLSAQIEDVVYYKDKKTGEPRHTAVTVQGALGKPQKIMFFNRVCKDLQGSTEARFVVTASKNTFRGRTSLSLVGMDFELM